MIKPLNAPQLSSAKQRSGLQSISELLPRLIRQYELQAELMKRRQEQSQIPPVAMESTAATSEQATFAWYESSRVAHRPKNEWPKTIDELEF